MKRRPPSSTRPDKLFPSTTLFRSEETQRRCQSLHEAAASICAMLDHAAEIYRVECGQPWSATTGSRTGRTLTASQIDARDFLAARAVEKREAHAPTGPVVVLSGGQDWTEHKALWDRLDAIKARIPDRKSTRLKSSH